MKRVRYIVVAVLAVLLVAGSLAFAQGQAGPRRGGPGGPGALGPMGMELRGLNLTDAQREQVRQILERYQQQIRSEVMLVLTPDQQQKLQQFEAQRQARRQERQQRQQQRTPQQN
jgi:Spy/CpxP family protein refolding chaperone